jgi:hypothetical protein
MAYRKSRKSTRSGKVTYGIKKKTSSGKFRKGTLIKYKYQNGRRVGAVKSRK